MADKNFVVKNGLLVGSTLTIAGVELDISNATSGQVLKFDGSKFAPASDITVDEPSSYSTTIGNGSSSSYTLTHNLNTRDVVVSVQDSASPYDVISVRSEATTANTVTLDFSSVVSSSSRDVLIISAGDLDYYTSTIGDGSNSSIVLNHNLGSRDIAVAVRNASSPYEFIDVATFATSPNKVTLDFSSAPSANTLVASVYLPLEGYSYSEIIGDGSDSVFTLTHDLNTRDVNVIIRETQSPYELIKTYWEATTADTVSVAFETAPSTGSIEVTVFNGLGGKLLAPSLNDLAVSVPASSTSDGQKGDLAYDENSIYLCTDSNTWKKTNLVDYDSVEDNVTTTTTISANSATTIGSFNATSFRSAEFTIQASQGTKYTYLKCLAIHDGSTVAVSQYGRTEIGSPAIPIVITSDISNDLLRLRATVSDANSTNVSTRVIKKTILSGSSSVAEVTSTVVSTNSATTVDSFSSQSYRSAEFTVQVTQGSKYTSIKCLVIHNNSAVTVTQYGRIDIGSPAIPATFTSDIVDNYLRLRCTITDASTTSATVNVIKERFPV